MIRRHRGRHGPVASILRYLGWHPGHHYRRVFRNTCHISEKFRCHERWRWSPSLRGPAADSVSRRALALVTTRCHDEGRLLFWLQGLTYLVRLYGFLTKIFIDAKWRQRKYTANGYEAGIPKQIHLWKIQTGPGVLHTQILPEIAFFKRLRSNVIN